MNTYNCNKPPHFISFYEEVIRGFQPKRMLEIGVQSGRSLQMWSEKLPEAEIVGLDIYDATEGVGRAKVVIGSQGDESVLKDLGKFDFIIDDGSHFCSHQISTYNVLWKQLNPGGLYVVEDTETSYAPQYVQNHVDTPITAIAYLALAGFMIDNDFAYKWKV